MLPPIYWRGMERRTPESARRRLAGLACKHGTVHGSRAGDARHRRPVHRRHAAVAGEPVPAGIARHCRPGAGAGPGGACWPPARRIRVFPRSDVPVQAQWFPDPASNQWIAVIDSGVNVIVDGVERRRRHDRHLDRPAGDLDHRPAGARPDRPDAPGPAHALEIYMEGNIVFRQGERMIYADRMYYDVPNHVGTVLDAEVLTPVPQLRRAAAAARRRAAADRPRTASSPRTPSSPPAAWASRAIGSRRATSTSRTSSSRRSIRAPASR